MTEEMETKEPMEPMDDMGITDDDKLWALLSFIIPLIALIVLLLEDKKDRPFIRYAAVTSLALAVVTIVLGIIPVIQCASPLVWFYSIFLGIQAYGGQWVVVPGLTDFMKGQGWIQ